MTVKITKSYKNKNIKLQAKVGHNVVGFFLCPKNREVIFTLNRQKKLTVRFTPKEYEQLQKKAAIAGMKMDPFVRALIFECNIRPRPPDSYRELSKELAAIGNNINQITHLANSVGTVSPAQIEAVKYRMEQVWQLVQERV